MELRDARRSRGSSSGSIGSISNGLCGMLLLEELLDTEPRSGEWVGVLGRDEWRDARPTDPIDSECGTPCDILDPRRGNVGAESSKRSSILVGDGVRDRSRE